MTGGQNGKEKWYPFSLSKIDKWTKWYMEKWTKWYTDKWYWTKWYGQNGMDKMVLDKMVWTKWYTDKMVYGQNGVDKMVWTKWGGYKRHAYNHQSIAVPLTL